MRFKLDENFGSRSLQILIENGHEAETVYQERLCGTSDETIFAVCQREQRCLMTLDLDFSDVMRFPPDASFGIAVFRPPKRANLGSLDAMAQAMLELLQAEPITGRLWIIESRRIRVHEGTI